MLDQSDPVAFQPTSKDELLGSLLGKQAGNRLQCDANPVPYQKIDNLV